MGGCCKENCCCSALMQLSRVALKHLGLIHLSDSHPRTNQYHTFSIQRCQGHVESNVEVLHFSADNKVSGSCYRAPKHDDCTAGEAA